MPSQPKPWAMKIRNRHDDAWRSVGEVAAAIREDLDRRRLAHPSGEGAAGLREEKAGALEAARRK